MNTKARGVFLVGTFPAPGKTPEETEEAAMVEPLRAFEGLPFHSLSDGETGKREGWIIPAIERQRDNPFLELERDGDYSDYKHTPLFRVAKEGELTPGSLNLHYARFAPGSFKRLMRLREEYGRPDLALQVSMPHALDHALYTLGEQGLKYLGVYEDAVSDQINKISDIVGSDGIIQIESPATFVTASRSPDKYLPAVLQRQVTAGSIARLAARAPVGTRFGVHFCLGDMNNKAQTDRPLESGKPVVDLSKALVDAWPNGQRLEYIHFPVAGGDKPPEDQERIYQQLQGLGSVVPAQTRIIAGLAHEGAKLDEQQRVLELLEANIGRRVDVAPACGIARARTLEAASTIMSRMKELAIS